MRSNLVLSLTVVITTFLVEFTTVQPGFAGCTPRFQCVRPRIFPNVCLETRYIIIPHRGELNHLADREGVTPSAIWNHFDNRFLKDKSRKRNGREDRSCICEDDAMCIPGTQPSRTPQTIPLPPIATSETCLLVVKKVPFIDIKGKSVCTGTDTLLSPNTRFTQTKVELDARCKKKAADECQYAPYSYGKAKCPGQSVEKKGYVVHWSLINNNKEWNINRCPNP
jgi:hypothetical protein